jgi:hypothetical protein
MDLPPPMLERANIPIIDGMAEHRSVMRLRRRRGLVSLGPE